MSIPKFQVQRTQYIFDLSGVRARSRSDTLTYQRQWNTFETVENYNDVIYQQFQIGYYAQPYYQFRSGEEYTDYKNGQQLHVRRYPWLDPTTFNSINTRPLPNVSTILSRPQNYTFSPTTGALFSTPMTATEYIAQKSDMSTYVHVSSYNAEHVYKYMFTSADEQLAYRRAAVALGAVPTP
jgi:hypothetical protein